MSVCLRYAVLAILLVLSGAANAWVWHGLKDARPVAGPSIQEKDLFGKVVLVYNFTATTYDAKVLQRTQKLHETLDRTKFTVVGSCKDERGVAALAKRHGVAYPVYKEFRVVTAMEKAPGTLYFVDEYGRMIWQSRDAASQRDLERALVGALACCGKPPSLTAGASFTFHKALKDQLVYGKDVSQVEKLLEGEVAAGRKASANAEAKAKAAEAQQILNAIGRGMEQMVPNVRVLMDIDIKRAYRFLDLHLKSFPRDRERYAKLYEELANRAARER